MTQDPPRLKDLTETPPELGAALDALRQAPNDAARVARVGARIGPWLDAPAPPPVSTGLARRMGPHTIKAARLFVAGMVVGASVLWLSPWPRQADKPLATRPAPAASVAPGEPVIEALPSQEPHQAEPAVDALLARGPARFDPQPVVSSAAPSHAGHGASAGHAVRTGRAATRFSGAAPRASMGEPGGTHTAHADTSGVATERSAAAHGAAVAEPEPPSPADAALKQAAEEPPAERQVEAPPPKGEVDLLFQARQLRRSAPRKALALLDEHAARFADGMLAPEREVIAIEILRALGQSEQAAQRLARYRASYPQSLHLPGLENKR
jgi:hypothetical protein